MSDERTMAIVCASGGFRGAFVHGVLAAFEEHGLRADAYAGVSSTAPTAAAAVGAWVGDVPITTMTPDMNPADLNVDFVTAGENGLGELFNHGREKGAAFVR